LLGLQTASSQTSSDYSLTHQESRLTAARKVVPNKAMIHVPAAINGHKRAALLATVPDCHAAVVDAVSLIYRLALPNEHLVFLYMFLRQGSLPTLAESFPFHRPMSLKSVSPDNPPRGASLIPSITRSRIVDQHLEIGIARLDWLFSLNLNSLEILSRDLQCQMLA
jgi:hypothetical protein